MTFDEEKKKKPTRRTKGYDSEEDLVMEDYEKDLRNDASIKRKVKGLTRKSKVRYQGPLEDLSRSNSAQPIRPKRHSFIQ